MQDKKALEEAFEVVTGLVPVSNTTPATEPAPHVPDTPDVVDAHVGETEAPDGNSAAPANEPEKAIVSVEAVASIGALVPEIHDIVPESGNKIPEGAAIVACELWRDEGVSGKFTTAVYRGWCPFGKAVAFRNGHVLASNYIFGRISGGIPTVSPCKVVTCKKCGRRELMPFAVWRAKDEARRQGKKDAELDNMTAWSILNTYGKHECGGCWTDDTEGEKRDLFQFADDILRAVSVADSITEFRPPTAFSVSETVSGGASRLPAEWRWIDEGLKNAGKSAKPFDKDDPGEILMYNPGSWYGWSRDIDATGLFFRGTGNRSGSKACAGFNPHGISGL